MVVATDPHGLFPPLSPPGPVKDQDKQTEQTIPAPSGETLAAALVAAGQRLPVAPPAPPIHCNKAQGHVAASPSDSDLVHRVVADDREAFEALYLRYRPDLLLFVCRRYAGSLDEHTAEDAISGMFASLWQNRHRLGSVRNLRAYLTAIARNLLADALADRKADRSAPPLADIISSAPSPAVVAERTELAGQIDRAIDSLAESHRLAMEMSQAGLSAHQIATISNCTEKAAQRRVEKARDRMKQLLCRCGKACVMDSHRQEECPAFRNGLECLKYWYMRQICFSREK